MPHEPKKRHSRARQGKRRNHIKLSQEQGIICPNCKTPTKPHTVCRNCGYYKGKEVKKVKTKATVRKVEK